MAVDDDQIERTVEVEISQHTAKTETVSRRRANSRAYRHVFVGFGPGGLVQADHLVVEIRDGQPLAPGAVKITGIDAHAGARLAIGTERQPGFHSDILEGAVF